jgi:hypothetical protein
MGSATASSYMAFRRPAMYCRMAADAPRGDAALPALAFPARFRGLPRVFSTIGKSIGGPSCLYPLSHPTRDTGVGQAKQLRRIDLGKYPPAKPGALWFEPLKAVGGVAEATP